MAPAPKTAASATIRSSTTWIMVPYMPTMRRRNEPEIPGSTMAHMATAPEANRTTGEGSITGAPFSPRTANRTIPTKTTVVARSLVHATSRRAMRIEANTRPVNRPAIDSGWSTRACSITPANTATAASRPVKRGSTNPHGTSDDRRAAPRTSPRTRHPRARAPVCTAPISRS